MGQPTGQDDEPVALEWHVQPFCPRRTLKSHATPADMPQALHGIRFRSVFQQAA